jgi:hypothetical protein
MKTAILLKATLKQVGFRLASALSKTRYEKFDELWFKDLGLETTENDRGVIRQDRVWQCMACGKKTIIPGRHAWAHEQLGSDLT